MSFNTERFIAKIQNRPCLWDTTSKDYCDSNLKIKCWYEIVDSFKEKDEMTAQERKELADSLQKRWKNISGCYTREINRQKSVKSGFVCGSRKSEYIYFKQLQFLQKVVALRESDSVAAPADPVADTADPETELQKDRQVDARKRQKTIDNTVSEDEQFIAGPNKSIENSDVNNQDEDRLFLLSLVKTLNQVPPHRKLATRIKIMSVLEEETAENAEHFWSQPLESETVRCYGYSTGHGSSYITSEVTESSVSSHDLPSRSNTHGNFTRHGAPNPGVPHTIDYVVHSPNAPTTIFVSDDSS